MNLLRAAARTMLAGYFVVNGVKALKDPAPYAAEQERFASTVVPLARKVAPEVATSLPQDTETYARVAGGLQVAGGLGLISGKGRRLGAGLIALSMVPQLMGFSAKGLTPEEKALARNDLLKNVALLGGSLIAAGDTEGRPGLAWRAQDSAAKLSRSVDHTRRALSKDAELTKLQLARQVDNVKHRVALQAKDLTH
ncbi:DoxX family protein [Granulicoccus sp. GXG6511]|uniref:DoxX family protein n=1 Tax=Granulicoccus sp. GXG6511 TaxID=3381351 RepID=UPI003D7DD0C0